MRSILSIIVLVASHFSCNQFAYSAAEGERQTALAVLSSYVGYAVTSVFCFEWVFWLALCISLFLFVIIFFCEFGTAGLFYDRRCRCFVQRVHLPPFCLQVCVH